MAFSLLIDDGLFETRAALLQGGRLQELQIERLEDVSRVGDFYLGRVAKVMDDLDVAFVDLGNSETGFLQARDIVRKHKGIGSLVHEGQKLLVQVIKDPLDDKGVQLGCHFQLASPNLLFRPNGKGLVMAKQITAQDERDRLASILEPRLKTGGLIVRTSARLASEAVLEAEISRLLRAWREIDSSQGQIRTPRRLSPPKTPLDRILNDLLRPGMNVRVTTAATLKAVRSYAKENSLDDVTDLGLWTAKTSLFEEYEVEAQIEIALDKRIDLKEGVSITLEPTEAMVVIDVNSSSHTHQQGQEDIALKSNLIAASEIARQIRLRNYSGIIIIDFIQMSGTGDMKQLQRHMEKLLQEDPVQTRMIGLTELGLMQITRQRSKRALHSVMTVPCTICQGSGRHASPVNTPSSLLRALESHVRHTAGSEIDVVAAPDLFDQMAARQSQIENHLGRRLCIRKDADLPSQAFLIK